jgi:hypothetical protein
MKRLPVIEDAPAARASRVALISLTTFCNAHCRFCCVLDILNRPELNPEDEAIFARIADARAHRGVLSPRAGAGLRVDHDQHQRDQVQERAVDRGGAGRGAHAH